MNARSPGSQFLPVRSPDPFDSSRFFFVNRTYSLLLFWTESSRVILMYEEYVYDREFAAESTIIIDDNHPYWPYCNFSWYRDILKNKGGYTGQYGAPGVVNSYRLFLDSYRLF